mgnify:CR=1 FL=1
MVIRLPVNECKQPYHNLASPIFIIPNYTILINFATLWCWRHRCWDINCWACRRGLTLILYNVTIERTYHFTVLFQPFYVPIHFHYVFFTSFIFVVSLLLCIFNWESDSIVFCDVTWHSLYLWLRFVIVEDVRIVLLHKLINIATLFLFIWVLIFFFPELILRCPMLSIEIFYFIFLILI